MRLSINQLPKVSPPVQEIVPVELVDPYQLYRDNQKMVTELYDFNRKVTECNRLMLTIQNNYKVIEAIKKSNGVSNTLLEIYNTHGDMCSILKVSNLPTITNDNREQWTEVALEGLMSGISAAWELFLRFWNWAKTKVKELLGITSEERKDDEALKKIKEITADRHETPKDVKIERASAFTNDDINSLTSSATILFRYIEKFRSTKNFTPLVTELPSIRGNIEHLITFIDKADDVKSLDALGMTFSQLNERVKRTEEFIYKLAHFASDSLTSAHMWQLDDTVKKLDKVIKSGIGYLTEDEQLEYERCMTYQQILPTLFDIRSTLGKMKKVLLADTELFVKAARDIVDNKIKSN